MQHAQPHAARHHAQDARLPLIPVGEAAEAEQILAAASPDTEVTSQALNNAAIAATDAIGFLREALRNANAVEALVLMPLIGDAASLQMSINALVSARAERA